jgi:hypothetical protein
MMMHHSKKDRRQAQYLSRARSARFYARMLMPVTALAASGAMWMDPVIGPRMAERYEFVQPIIAKVIEDPSILTTFTTKDLEFDTDVEVADASDAVDTAQPSGLPPSTRPVNRP